MVKTLLPSGCYDLLPPHAKAERELVVRLLREFDAFGYEQVSPPLLEYTESLLAGRGASLAAQTFRVIDPDANKVMGIRPDITLQIARIAATRLAGAPKPLRLSYAGPILRLSPEQLHGARQMTQTGIEIIGADARADAEVIVVAVRALTELGIKNLSVDLNLPGIVGLLTEGEAQSEQDAQALFAAIAHKDAASVAAMKLEHGKLIAALMESAGPAESTLAKLRKLKLPEEASRQLEVLESLVALLTKNLNGVAALTLDITEHRGLEYHSGVCFSLFAGGAASMLGCGGRYRVIAEQGNIEATGITLYTGPLLDLTPDLNQNSPRKQALKES